MSDIFLLLTNLKRQEKPKVFAHFPSQKLFPPPPPRAIKQNTEQFSAPAVFSPFLFFNFALLEKNKKRRAKLKCISLAGFLPPLFFGKLPYVYTVVAGRACLPFSCKCPSK